MEKQIPYVVPLSSNPAKTITLVPNDPGSRYKTKQLQVQVVGKSKMIKTVLVNILDCAKYMQVPPSYLGTFMGYEIGAQAKFDAKKPERQQAFLSGEHDTKDLSRICCQFITEVVLCPNCGLPEILIDVEDGKKVMGTCRACGAHSELPITNEKFKRYVLNHPPTSNVKNTKGAFSGNKAGAKKDTSKKKKAEDDEDSEEDAEAEEQELTKQFKEADKAPKKDEVVWFSDTSTEAVKKRREEMLPDTEIFQGVAAKPKVEDVKRILDGANPVEELQKAKKATGLADAELVSLVFDALVSPDTDLVALAKSKQSLFSKVATSPAAQFALLDSIEKFCVSTNKKLLPKVPQIIKEYYDLDLLEEENILEWYKKETPATTNIREQLAPLVKWLEEAEEESEDEDEEDEE